MKTPTQLKSLFGTEYDWLLATFYYLGCIEIYQKQATVIVWCFKVRKWHPIPWLFIVVLFIAEMWVEVVRKCREFSSDDLFGETNLREVQEGDSKMFDYDAGGRPNISN